LHTNGIPVFCEIDPHSLTVDPDDLEERITPRTKAIAVVHVFGYVANMDAIMAVAKEHGLIVVEDCSHAHGAEWDGKKVGTIGHLGCFSLQASKPVIAGEGGAIITDDTEFYERSLILGHYGRIARDLVTDKYRHLGNMGLGWKYRAHPLAVGIAKVQLSRLNELNDKRGQIAQYWDEELAKLPGIEPVYTYPKAKRGGYLGYLLIYHSEAVGGLPKEKFMAALQAEGVSVTDGFYQGDLHLQSLFNGFNFYGDRGCPFGCPHVDKVRRYETGSLPVSESIGPKVLSLPVFTAPPDGLVQQYVEAFRKVVENIDEIIY
jgi:dTDP-4-amino-4,6-dideoxygalactose transaminase